MKSFYLGSCMVCLVLLGCQESDESMSATDSSLTTDSSIAVLDTGSTVVDLGPVGMAGNGGEAGSGGLGGMAGSAGAAGEAGTGGSAGSAGEAGTGGSAGSAGEAGTGGSAGAAGEAGTGGSAGAAGEAGAGGSAGVAGEAGAGGVGGVGGDGGNAGAGGMAGADESQCEVPMDCLDEAWPVRCMGRWVCVENRCQPDVCGPESGCGDGVCEPMNGESAASCSVDCQNPVGPACRGDVQCPPHQRCDPCAGSSCPDCDDCVAGCVEHGCETEREPVCNALRPECEEGQVAIVEGGCWECVEYAECGQADPPAPEECIPAGGARAVVPNALPCCEGLVSIGCESPSVDTGGQCQRGCLGATYCTDCGNGVCEDAENDCNCPEDCAR